jgi:hypothetical protein
VKLVECELGWAWADDNGVQILPGNYFHTQEAARNELSRIIKKMDRMALEFKPLREDEGGLSSPEYVPQFPLESKP